MLFRIQSFLLCLAASQVAHGFVSPRVALTRGVVVKALPASDSLEEQLRVVSGIGVMIQLEPPSFAN